MAEQIEKASIADIKASFRKRASMALTEKSLQSKINSPKITTQALPSFHGSPYSLRSSIKELDEIVNTEITLPDQMMESSSRNYTNYSNYSRPSYLRYSELK